MTAQRRPLAFYKMHSLGNDFMVVDAVSQTVHLSTEQIARWGDRHTGIGFDQLLIIEPPTTPDADFYYRIYNSDGSSAQQCGNGTRCVAMLAQKLQLTKKNTLNWQSAAGPICTVYESPEQIKTTMTVPVLELDNIPFNASAASPILDSHAQMYRIEAEGSQYEVTPVSMGNPHAVIFLDDIFEIDIDVIGAKLTGHEAFPEGANIGFCQIIDRQFMRLRVYERGVGETRACGSGACAAVVAAKLQERVDDRVKVSLPGGKLKIKWPHRESAVTMHGAATFVFSGEIDQDGELSSRH